jgi:hypothetical protein
MSFWTKIMSIGALGVTLLSSVPAWAVSPYGGPHSVCRSNSAGQSFVTMAPSASTFCYLSNVNIQETDTGGESAQCTLLRGYDYWYLSANLGASSDADVCCTAHCYSN